MTVRESGLGGLACALHLAALGHQVAVQHRQEGLEIDGYQFDATPFVLGDRTVLDSLLQLLGERPDDWLDLLPVTATGPVRGLGAGSAWYPQGGMSALARALVSVAEKNGVTVGHADCTSGGSRERSPAVEDDATTVTFPPARVGSGCLIIHLGTGSAYPRKGFFEVIPRRLTIGCPTWTDSSLAPAGHQVYQLVAPGDHGDRRRAAELVTMLEANGYPDLGAAIAVSYVTRHRTPLQLDASRLISIGSTVAKRYGASR